MSSARPQEGFPTVPATLNAGDPEMRDYYADHPDYAPNTTPYYTPYLGLRARLSQIWINKWTVLLALVLCRVLLAVKNLDHDIANAKTEALSACTGVENIGSAMASMPHYMSAGVNAIAADGVTKAVNGLMEMLTMTVTGVEEIVLFVINMLTSTYVCLIQLVIAGSLHVAIEMIEKVGDFMNKSISSITSEINKDVGNFQNTLNGFLSGVGDLTGLFGGSKPVPKIDLTSHLTALNSIKVDPTQMDKDLDDLNKHIPTFEQVQNFTNNLIRLPFEEIKTLINSSVAAYTFDKSVFPLAQKQALTFCTDNNGISDFFTGLSDLASLARKIFIAVITILAILACIPMAYREIWKWRTMQQRAMLLQKHAFDPVDVIYIASRPYTSTAGIKAASKFKSTKRQILTRWFISYATSIPALFVLILGFAGLFSCLCQYILLKSVEKEVPALASEVGDFAGTVVNALNNASEAWAVSANHVIEDTNTKLNDEIFKWVTNGTAAINSTLAGFMSQINTAINDTFGNTILYEPISGTIKCLLGLKVDAVEKGLTWVHDHAHINFPEFRKDTFSLGAAASLTNSSAAESFLSSPGSVATDDITNAIVKLTNAMQEAITEEAYIAAALVCIWVFIMLIGLTRALIGMLGRDKTRAEGGPVGYTGDHRLPISPRIPNNNGAAAQFSKPATATMVNPRSEKDDGWSAGGLGGGEKVGHAGHRSVLTRKGHERASSYGVVGDEKI